MKTDSTITTLFAAVAAAATLAACGAGEGTSAATPTGNATAPKSAPVVRTQAPQAPVVIGRAGVVTAVVPMESTEPTSGAGAVIGGVLGAAVGNQIGGGDGKKAATVVGAVGGAVAGNKIEKNRNTHVTGYRVDVRLDNGESTSVTTSQAGAAAVGQRVRIVDGQLRPA
jgi:outer membrane lipoprotein SlyB